VINIIARRVDAVRFGKSRTVLPMSKVLTAKGRTLKQALENMVAILLIKRSSFTGFELLCPNYNAYGSATIVIRKNSNVITKMLHLVKYYEIDGARDPSFLRVMRGIVDKEIGGCNE
jgi:hypothetical protein